MFGNWVNSLDSLAAGGVIDFDAPAYLLDQPARYVGHPKFSELPMTELSLLPEGVKLKDLPRVDEFNNSNKNLVTNPSWKKRVFGLLAGAGAIALAVLGFKKFGLGKLFGKGKKVIKTKLKPKPSGKKAKNITSGLKNFGKKVWSYIKTPFTWIGGKFKKKTP